MEDKINQIIKEYINNTYPAYSELPRKDFSPTASKGYNNIPYQSTKSLHTDIQQVDDNVSLNSKQLLWPMQTISEDLADSWVYLYAALLKMKDCLKSNTAANKEQRIFLRKMIKICKTINNSLLKAGKELDKKFDLSNMANKSIKI